MNNRFEYPPSHPWYYQYGKPLPVGAIGPGDPGGYAIPASRKEQEACLAQAEKDLARDTEQYLGLVENGEGELSEYERSFDRPGFARAIDTALALKHNHISYNRGLIAALKQALGPQQAALF